MSENGGGGSRSVEGGMLVLLDAPLRRVRITNRNERST